jgi:hypothetical protein
MIDQAQITKEWIHQVSLKNRNADKILVEKVIRAFQLLEGLIKARIPFVFKGGTALMLQLSHPNRLSIDIDIILSEELDHLSDILNRVAQEQGFLRQERQFRTTASAIRKQHYKFFFTPLHKTNRQEEFVLLDILYEKVNYGKLLTLPVTNSFLPEDTSPLMVVVPCPEDILGDKLTAFAPNTTGIPYFREHDSMSMEIIKQLYDIGRSMENISDVEILKGTFRKFAETELLYRGDKRISVEDVLEDIYQTALCIVTRGSDGNGDFGQIQSGIRRITGFIISQAYHIEKAITDASIAAWLSTMIRFDGKSFEKFKDPAQIKDWTIAEPYNTKLNRLKKSNPEAFHYWYKIAELQGMKGKEQG